MSDDWKSQLPEAAVLDEEKKTITVHRLQEAMEVLEVMPASEDDNWSFIITRYEERLALELFRRGMRW